jgi:hypothetical protein
MVNTGSPKQYVSYNRPTTSKYTARVLDNTSVFENVIVTGTVFLVHIIPLEINSIYSDRQKVSQF